MKTGIIKAIQPDGGYSAKTPQGPMYIYQYQMTIEVPGEGQVTGEIGSKSDPYPMQVNEEITFEIKLDARATTGKKFKKVNPQYAQGGSQGGGQAPQGQNSGGSIPKDRIEGMVRTQFIKAAIINGMIKCDTFADVLMLTNFAMTGVIPQERQSQSHNTEVGQDDIPF